MVTGLSGLGQTRQVTASTKNDKPAKLGQIFQTYFKTRNADQMANSLKNEGIKMVVFDMDGTILDSEKLAADCTVDAMAPLLGRKMRWNEAEKYAGLTTLDFAKQVLNDAAVPHADEHAREVADQVQNEFREGLREGKSESFPYMHELIKDLHKKGFKTALITNSMRDSMQINIDRFNLKGFLHINWGFEDMNGKPKPSPYIYQRAMRESGISQDQTIIFEDSTAGLTSARDSGAYVMAVRNLEEHKFNSPKTGDNSRIHELDLVSVN